MRREMFRMERADAVALFARAPLVHIASTTPEGAPVLRTVHGVVVRGALAFHGSPVGEKTESIGREAVASSEEVVALIPSYFLDPERACPATTIYRSAQAHGLVERVDDAAHKAEVLSALMTKYQPEGGYLPIEAEHPLYKKAVDGIMVLQISLERLDGKAKLFQNRSPEDRIRVMEGLWKRGQPGDAEAIEQIRAANPGSPLPPFLRGPAGTTLAVAPGRADTEAAVALLDGAYWNVGFTEEEIARAHLGSPVWVGARDAQGALVATARALTDTAKRAWVYDVAVAPALRGKGVGQAVVRLLLDHPAMRRTRRVYLRTRDAQAFYAPFGFVDRGALEIASQPASSSDMVLVR